MEHTEAMQLLEVVVRDGIEAHESDVATFVAALGAPHDCDVLVAIVADRAGPAVARERALGRLVGARSTLAGTPDPARLTEAA